MNVLASVALSTAVLALGLIIQSRLILDSPSKRLSLGRQLQQLGCACLPISVSLIVLGIVIYDFATSFFLVGVILFFLMLALLTQGYSIVHPDRRRFGQAVWWSAWGAAFVSIGIILYVLIRISLPATESASMAGWEGITTWPVALVAMTGPAALGLSLYLAVSRLRAERPQLSVYQVAWHTHRSRPLTSL